MELSLLSFDMLKTVSKTGLMPIPGYMVVAISVGSAIIPGSL